MLSLAYAAAGNRTEREWREYRGQAFSFVRERIGTPGTATSESTIGAILLLAGVEVSRRLLSLRPLHVCLLLSEVPSGSSLILNI